MLARTVQLCLLFGSRTAQTLLRMALAPLIVYICEEPEMTCAASTKGSLLSAFSLGYILTQVVGGALADRLGPATVIMLAMATSGMLMVASGSAGSVERLWLLQVAMGAAQGPLFPTSVSYLARWLPADERAFGSSFLDAGITAGSLVALPFSGRLAALFGWRATLRLWGACALVFSAVWHILACADPAQCRSMSREEREHLKRAIPPVATSHDKTGRPAAFHLLSKQPLGAIFVAHMAFNFGVYFINSWMPTYYQDVLSTRPDEAVLAFAIPPLLNLLVKVRANFSCQPDAPPSDFRLLLLWETSP